MVCSRIWETGRLWLVLSVLVALVLTGCGGAYKATQPSRPSLEETEKIIYKDLDLKYSVGVVDVSQDYVNGLLRARCRLRNLTGDLVNAEIKIKFRDAQDYELGDPAWTPLPLESSETRSFEQIATTRDAVDFRIILQKAGSQ